jgi:hypothetical protein
MMHLLERFEAGSPDDRWIQDIAQDDDRFLVITGDRAAKTRQGDPRLPVILPQAGVSGVFLTGKLQQRPAFEKVRALMYVWPLMEKAAQHAGGARWRLMLHGDGYSLKEWPL